MNLSELDRKIARVAPLVLLVLGALLVLPRLSSFGFWDPSEVRVADAARNLIELPQSPIVNRAPPALATRVVAEGFRRMGVGEMGGRLPLALVSLLALFATYYLGRALLRPRAALIGALALGTMPSFLFGARQLSSAAPGLLAFSLALGGLVRLAWPVVTEGALGLVVAVVAAAAGLYAGHAASGLLVGVIAPLLTIALALAADRKAKALAVGAITAALAVAAALALRKLSAYSPLLNGVPRTPQYQTVVTSLLHQLGFSTAPWLAIVPFALLRALDGEQRTRSDGERGDFSRLVLPAALASLYVAATAHFAMITDIVVPAGPIIGLLAGVWIDDALDDLGTPNASSRALEGVSIAALAIIFGHDIMLTTDAFVSVQASEQIRWPQQIYWTGDVLFGFMSLFALLLAIALAAPAVLGAMGNNVKLQRACVLGAVAVQLLFGFAVVQWFIPAASKHLSPKDLYGKTKQLDPKAPLGQYRFNATGASYFMNGRSATALATLDEVLTFLQKPERVFVFVGSEELASIDQATRRGAHPGPSDGATPAPTALVSYVVVDDSNSRFLILSNRLGNGETDLNPLRRYVSETPPTPKTELSVNFEDKLQLLGFELPAEVAHGEDVRVKMYFKVLAPLGGTYKIFIHFDGPGARINGDHTPLDGKFPTQFWTPGTFVTDEYVIKPDRATEPSGAFQLFFGFFAGDKRLKVKDGPSDGENRVRLGLVRVK